MYDKNNLSLILNKFKKVVNNYPRKGPSLFVLSILFTHSCRISLNVICIRLYKYWIWVFGSILAMASWSLHMCLWKFKKNYLNVYNKTFIIKTAFSYLQIFWNDLDGIGGLASQFNICCTIICLTISCNLSWMSLICFVISVFTLFNNMFTWVSSKNSKKSIHMYTLLD